MKLYRVKLILEHDEVSGGERFKAELPLNIEVFAADNFQAEDAAIKTLPPYLRKKVNGGCTVTEILGEGNRQLETILRK